MRVRKVTILQIEERIEWSQGLGLLAPFNTHCMYLIGQVNDIFAKCGEGCAGDVCG